MTFQILLECKSRMGANFANSKDHNVLCGIASSHFGS